MEKFGKYMFSSIQETNSAIQTTSSQTRETNSAIPKQNSAIPETISAIQKQNSPLQEATSLRQTWFSERPAAKSRYAARATTGMRPFIREDYMGVRLPPSIWQGSCTNY